MSEERKVNPLKAFLSGGFGGICNVLTGHPLDTIKVRLQTMPRPAPGQPPMYKGTFDCAAKTIKNEGVRGLYKGMSAPLTGVAPIFALCFAGYALGKRVQQTGENTKLTYKQIAVAGSFSGLLSTIIMAPGERIKCLLQVQQASGGERKYNGMLDTAVKLYKEGGIRSVYKGSCATMLRDLPANAFYFLAYEFIQDQIKERTGSEKISVGSTIFAGGAAGIAYWMVGMPADVLKSRLQTDLPANAAYFATYEFLQDFQKQKFPDMRMGELTAIFSGGIAGIMYWIVGMPPDVLKSRLQTSPDDKYKHGVRSVFMELIKNDGPFALYRGVAPVMIRAFPANAACFFGIELANSFITFVAPNF